ncbi:MAG: hypothetical protein ACPG1Z_05535, partial [Planctomycetota bacterium]
AATLYEKLGRSEMVTRQWRISNRPQGNFFTSNAINIDSTFRLAQALDRAGDSQGSIEWYQKFLNAWGEADREIPSVKTAQNRLVELTSQ